ncbi:sensor histidine kinase [Roseospira navarrensis]|uniref:histidine kinase n=1 Tax=Roseospira navarrensis TaxID=140058 RepID=A0A7X2D2K4_9PROT|nr:HAMP domain-containing sensor histidine kinase [Roseospira navarrensis]MQX35873.1 HAMP domain-containing protein [Roseospira navarrensis]
MTQTWTITHWLAAIFMVAVLASGLLLGAMLQWQTNESVLRLAQNQARTTAHQVFQSVYASMRRGTAHDEIREIMARQNAGPTTGTVRLVRGEAVSGQYGVSPLSSHGLVTDPKVQAVFRSGETRYDMADGRVRYLFPLVLQEECAACHAGAVGRTVNGVITVDVALAALRQPLSLLSDTAFLGFMGALVVVFGALFVTVRLMIVRPIQALAGTMGRLAKDPVHNGRVLVGSFRARELRGLAASFNDLMGRVSRQRIDLEDQARALGDARDAAEDARIQADAANMAKSHFLASMSHELRTPLNAVMGFAEVLRDEMFGPLGSAKYREYAQDIHASGSHLRDLVDDLLDLARIEADKFELHMEPTPVCTEIQACIALFRERAAAKRLSLTGSCPGDLPPLIADGRALRQMLFNLVSNAVKYTPDGGRIRVSASATDTTVALAVSDTGIGIRTELHELVFAAYGRVQDVVTRDIEGTGLGLSLVRALMEKHGGAVTLDSTPGRGSTFTLVFPRQVGPDEGDRWTGVETAAA